MRRLRAIAWKTARWLAAGIAIALVLLLTPVAYVEVACRGDKGEQTFRSVIPDATFHRAEANSYLTYPEWHIVYAYDGMAAALQTGDEYRFDYVSSITGFWRSACALMRVADGHGGADWDTRSTIHTIGVSFTTEMAAKGAYEETIGRATAWLRGGTKTPQDKVIAAMAVDYARFLRQTPWYRYPFRRETAKLWDAPSGGIRGWERRLGVGLEFAAKAGYARVIGGAVAATGEAQLVIRSIVVGLDASTLSSLEGVTVIAPRGDGIEIETPRYDLFTRILVEIAKRGGTLREIAGSDDIMVSLTVLEASNEPVRPGTVILRLKRDGFPSARVLVDLKVSELATFLNNYPLGDPGLEHVFDY
jgi:hypothetical protein